MSQDERLDVNRASMRELVEAGVMPELAQRIVLHRDVNGPIRDENELYQLVRDNEIRLDQLLGVVQLRTDLDNSRGYST